MELDLLRALITPATMLAFLAVCVWAYSSKNKKRFEEDADLPFADDVEGRQGASGDRSE